MSLSSKANQLINWCYCNDQLEDIDTESNFNINLGVCYSCFQLKDVDNMVFIIPDDSFFVTSVNDIPFIHCCTEEQINAIINFSKNN